MKCEARQTRSGWILEVLEVKKLKLSCTKKKEFVTVIEELCKGKNISITLWGDGIEQQKWMEWYKEVKELFGCLGYVHTHIGIQSASYKNGKVMTVNRKEKEILSKLDKGEEPENLSLYSLTGDYKVAMFDYDVLCARDKEYLSFVLKKFSRNPVSFS